MELDALDVGDLDEVTHLLTVDDPDSVCRVIEQDALDAWLLAHDDEETAVKALIKT
jgi:hypothetical protein